MDAPLLGKASSSHQGRAHPSCDLVWQKICRQEFLSSADPRPGTVTTPLDTTCAIHSKDCRGQNNIGLELYSKLDATNQGVR